MPDPAIEMLPVDALRPWARNARTHSKKQVRQIAESIRTFGFTNPILIDAQHCILAGHGRIEAAKLLGMEKVPCVRLDHMTMEQKRAYVLADNKLALNAGWDDEVLAEELRALLDIDIDFEVEVTGFSICRDRQPGRGVDSGRARRPGGRCGPQSGRRQYAAGRVTYGNSERTD